MGQSSETDARSLTLGVLGLAFGAATLGFAAPLVKLSELGPQATLFWRLFLSLPVLAVWAALEKKPAHAPKTDFRFVALAGLLFAGDLAFWHAGIVITTAANATLLANLAPLVVVVGAWFLFGERPTRAFIFAAGLALGGAVLISAANIEIDRSRLPGDGLSMITALWYGSYMLCLRAARRTATTGMLLFGSTVVSASAAGVIALLSGEALWPQSSYAWTILLLLGVGVHVAGQGGMAFGFGRVPAGPASILILFQPLVAAAAGWVLFGETMVAIQFLGAGAVLAGAWLSRRAAR